MSVKQHIQAFMDHIAQEGYTAHRQGMACYHLSFVRELLGENEEVTVGQLRTAVRGVRYRQDGRRLAEASRANIFKTWVWFFKWAKEAQRLEVSKQHFKAIPKLSTRSKSYAMPPEKHFQLVINALDEYADHWRLSRLRDAFIVSIAEEGGMRQKAIHELEYHDVLDALDNPTTLDGATIYQTTSLSKGGRDVLITFGERTAGYARRLIEQRPEGCNSPYLLVNKSGKRLTRGALRNAFIRLSNHAGLPKHIYGHAYRHRFITGLLNDGVPVHVVSRLANHSEVSTTLDNYAHADEHDLMKAIMQRQKKEKEC